MRHPTRIENKDFVAAIKTTAHADLDFVLRYLQQNFWVDDVFEYEDLKAWAKDNLYIHVDEIEKYAKENLLPETIYTHKELKQAVDRLDNGKTQYSEEYSITVNLSELKDIISGLSCLYGESHANPDSDEMKQIANLEERLDRIIG